MPADDIYVVFNPRSGKGRGARLVGPVLDALGGRGRARPHGAPGTSAAGRGRHRPRLPAHRGRGRGRHLEQRGRRHHPLRTAPRSASCPRGPAATSPSRWASPRRTSPRCARIVRDGHTRPSTRGAIEDRHFLNVAGFGFDIAVIEDSWTVKLPRGRPALPLLRAAAAPPLPGLPGRDVGGRRAPAPARDAHARDRQRAGLRRAGSRSRPRPTSPTAASTPWPSPTCRCRAGCHHGPAAAGHAPRRAGGDTAPAARFGCASTRRPPTRRTGSGTGARGRADGGRVPGALRVLTPRAVA